MRRWLVVSLLVVLLALVGVASVGAGRIAQRGATRAPAPAPPATAPPATAAAQPAGGHAHHGAAATGGVDWSHVSDRDLDVASVFLTARDSGVAKALDRLRVLASHDRGLFNQGHAVAHALGRFAVAHAGYDPAVYAHCREDFQAGCYHGVLEGYFTSPRAASTAAVAPRALDALCRSIVAPGSPRLPLLECAHGMGHGLTARAHDDYRQSVRGCDALGDPDARDECHDGVFMEIAVQGTEPETGDGPPLLHRNDLRYPCDSVATAYQPSCWKYQPMIAFAFTSDLARTVRVCDAAPAASAAACYSGVGKQAVGWMTKAGDVVEVCRMATTPDRLAACVAGAAESYIDDTWTATGALAFCRAVPDAAKSICYTTVGARMGLIHASEALVARDCAPAEPRYVSQCIQGATRRTS